jgi:SAM-dependent methyltransferase
MSLRQHETSESSHRILNPFTDEKLMLLGALCRLSTGQRLLDLACGKGELLCRWSQEYGIHGHGVDISHVFLAAAHARAEELGVSNRVTFQHGDAGKVPLETNAYDVVSCIGATWIGGGLAGTLELMRPALRTNGLLLVGEPFWLSEPPAEAYEALSIKRDEFTSLLGTQERLEASGLELVEMVLADQDSWDRYVAAQWWNVTEWLSAHPEHTLFEEMRQFRDRSRRSYLGFGRQYLGWGVFVCRPLN